MWTFTSYESVSDANGVVDSITRAAAVCFIESISTDAHAGYVYIIAPYSSPSIFHLCYLNVSYTTGQCHRFPYARALKCREERAQLTVHICRSFVDRLNRSPSQSLPQYRSCKLARMFCLLFRNGRAAIVNTRWNIDFTLHFIIQRGICVFGFTAASGERDRVRF